MHISGVLSPTSGSGAGTRFPGVDRHEFLAYPSDPMAMIPLVASPRQSGAKPNALRRSGSIPCVLYGQKVENTLLECAAPVLQKVFDHAGKSALVELTIEGSTGKVPVLFRDIAFDPVTDHCIHADFYAVDLTKEVEVPIPLRFEGVSPAVRDLAGVLVVPLDHVTVRCLPLHLPAELSLSLDSLAQFGDVLTVRDIPLPPHVRILEEAAVVVATVQEQRKEEEVAPPAPVVAEGAVEGAVPTAEGASPAGSVPTEGAKDA
ncbi:50S ribosomal protein L25 [Candidatus Peregrinibacteria bacterium]|nr:50S ribosomal protein L25 [Candidatus Peregrinibacteria bacterium]